MAETILNLNTDSFDSTITEASKPVLVDFWAQWCGPCKQMVPILEDLATEMKDQMQFCKVDIDQNLELAQKFGIQSIPTLLLFKNGEVAMQVVGLHNKDQLKEKLSGHL